MSVTYAERVPSFRKIGTSVKEGMNISTSEMLDYAKLSNWNVEKYSLDEISWDRFVAPSNMYVTVRDAEEYDGEYNELHDEIYEKIIIGAVKERYTVVQNEDAFSWADGILDGGGVWDTAGSFNNYSKVFGSLLIDKNAISIDPNGLNDAVDLYLLVSTSHDGSLPLQASITPIRVICQNTLNMALTSVNKSEVPQTIKLRHTSAVDMKIEMARKVLGLTFTYASDFNKLANEMYQTKINNFQFDNLIKTLYPRPKDEDNKRGVTRWQNQLDLIHEIRSSKTNEGIRDTAWGVFNILTEKMEHYRQGDNEFNDALAATGFSPAATLEKNRILEAVLAL